MEPSGREQAECVRKEKLGWSAGEKLSGNDVERYARQLVLPSFGVSRQRRLARAKLLIVGAGGLGCPAAMYLAAAGVASIIIVDRGDAVDRSNLHRQIAHDDSRVGEDKARSLRDAILRLNPTISVVAVSEPVSAHNAEALVENVDIVLDCCDNVPTRYMIGDACALKRVPLVSGAAIGLEGQLSVYCHGDDAPCYRCIFPTAPPPACVTSCDSGGVLGPVPGVIGVLQATEALKILSQLERSEPLVGILLLYDAADTSFRRVKLRPRNPNCIACGSSSTKRIQRVSDFDYAAFVSGSEAGALCSTESNGSNAPVSSISAKEFAAWFENECSEPSRQLLLLDVRSSEQFAMCSLRDSINIPLDVLPTRTNKIRELLGTKDPNARFVVLCRRGINSQSAVRILNELDFKQAESLEGGLVNWRLQVDPSFPTY